MKLQAIGSVAEAERLVDGQRTEGKPRRTRRKIEGLAMPVKGRRQPIESREHRVLTPFNGEGDGRPTDLGPWAGEHSPPCGGRQKLCTEAYAEGRYTALQGMADQYLLGAQINVAR